ncbi:sarcosine dehydrogenase, mitochondrial-like [Ptychodera flava]|uniref:sarcosine dehydrogenase, mitochondrial-like n=1 Tax=Ptychodera flava TaxID=63121 RepID=UPI003969C82C
MAMLLTCTPKLICRRLSDIIRGRSRATFVQSTRAYCSSGKEDTSSGVPYEKTFQTDSSEGPSTLPEWADVVVIGGGSVGCSTLYHLTKLGVKNAVLLERNHLTSGTTWHTAGLVWRLRPNDVDNEILNYSRHLFMNVLEEETGISTGWITNGGLFIASNKERLDEYKRLHTLGKPFGIESHVLSPAESLDVYPLLNTNDLYGTLYSPGDGTVDPAGLCMALTKAATLAGAKVINNCPVTGFDIQEDDFGVKRVKAVKTESGTIRTPIVVNCTGVWAPHIGAMAGVKVPLVAMKHAYVVTERVEGVQNLPNIRDHDASIYLKVQGDGLSVGGYEPNPIFWDDVKTDFAFSLFDLDWDVFMQHVEGAINRVPCLETTGIKSTVCGPESFTPDHKPLMGEAPEVRGFYLGCGYNSSGMMLGGGCGKELAHWVVHGRPELDMYGYDIRRFPTSLTDNPKWVTDRSHEAYAKNYSMVFPHDEPLAGRDMRTDPFHKVLQDAGCMYQERHGWERPGWFTDKAAPVLDYDFYGSYDVPRHTNYEYENRLSDEYTFEWPPHHHVIGEEVKACRERVAVFNMSYFGKFHLVGPDAQKAVDWIFTNDLSKPAGSTLYTCMCNKMGGVESDLTVSKLEPGDGSSVLTPKSDDVAFYIAAGGGNSQQSWSHIMSTIQDMGLNCEMIDNSEEMGMLSVQGPYSREVLQQLTSTDLSNENFPFSTHQLATVAGHQVRLIRLTFVGELGWELHIPAESCVPVYQAIMAAGAKFGIANAGYRAIDSLSSEKGYRHWHADVRMDDTPLEANLAFTCKLKKDTPFLGREALERQKKDGLKKKLACLTVDGYTPLHGLEAIWRNGHAVGFLRTAQFAFALGKTIAYGYVHHPEGGVVNNAYLKEGEYHIESMGELFPATFHVRSPFDPKNMRIQGVYDDAVSVVIPEPQEARVLP